MPVISVVKDAEARTLTITARFDAPIDRVWQVWSDPRQLERWWGPPMYPATVTEHDLAPGGTVAYAMTGPEGERHGGWWRVRAADPPHKLEFESGVADAAPRARTPPPGGFFAPPSSGPGGGGRGGGPGGGAGRGGGGEGGPEKGARRTAPLGQIDTLLGPPVRA